MNGAYRINYSAAAAAFDRVASFYDESFTHTAVGRAQRKQVWSRLLAAFPPGSRILELNCGTGEDARFLRSHGRSVLSCDASAAMIEVARRRSCGLSNVEYRQIANENLGVLSEEKPFDGAFSNFSGLNCVKDLRPVAAHLAALVKPGARILLCFWSRVCLAEVLWYLLHGNARKALRRFAEESSATLGGMRMPVYYPSVGKIRVSFAPWFRLRSRCAIGLFVPPSYLESWVTQHPKVLEALEQLDRTCSGWGGLRDLGDHVLLEFVRCNA
jgi:ubiquinone/menaquinone biosynthesis C-methylase UbiE